MPSVRVLKSATGFNEGFELNLPRLLVVCLCLAAVGCGGGGGSEGVPVGSTDDTAGLPGLEDNYLAVDLAGTPRAYPPTIGALEAI
ncbi:MAG TPA: hypothetical protein VIL43_11585 [Burkholderiales bacterium]